MHKKRLRLLLIIIPILLITAFVIIRYALPLREKSKTQAAKQTASSPIDIRPAIIAKLQSLVKSGSDGLYDLSIEQIQPDVLSSTLDVFNAKLIPDSLALKSLDSLKKAPDDIYTISLDSLRITGINVDDLLHTSDMSFDSIMISKPVITCDHQPKPYNEEERKKEQGQTLYQKLVGQVKSLSIQSIIVKQCTYISKQKNKKDKIFNNVTMQASNLQIDSSTQFDKQRVFFSKKVTISANDFVSRTGDSLYFFKIGSIEINATDHSMIADKVTFTPRGNVAQFEKKLHYRGNRFDFRFPKIVAKNIDWWALTNNESFTADEMELYDATIKNYVDRRLPLPPNDGNIRDFPPQLLMKVPTKINVKKLNLHHVNVSYEEFNPLSGKSGIVTYNNINGTIDKISNMPAQMKTYGHTTAYIQGLFMHSAPFTSSFSFDLNKYATGNFSMTLSVSKLDKEIVNPLAESLGLFTVKTGTMIKGDTKIEGDNYNSNVNMQMLYNDLHLTQLKKDDNDTSLHKKTATSFIANVFLIKNNNPSHGDDPRNVNVTVTRKPSETFFGFVWKGTLTGILKTIGIPEKYADK